MIKLINKSKLKSEKIEGIINFLPKEYKCFDIELRIYQNVFSTIKMILSSKFSVSPVDFYHILRLGVSGLYSGDKADIIEIYLFNLPNENRCLHLTHCLFHEFRHLYQSKYNNEKHINDEISPKNLKSADDFRNYIHDENEIDAENFADSFYNENKTEIDIIWDITFEYEIKKEIVDL